MNYKLETKLVWIQISDIILAFEDQQHLPGNYFLSDILQIVGFLEWFKSRELLGSTEIPATYFMSFAVEKYVIGY